jgi:uncharacterized membrane protein
MKKGRLEAFSDGVIAIIITIMVLEFKVPDGDNGGHIQALIPLLPKFISYVLSFIYIGIYWNNHHHMMQMVHTTNGMALWANLNLLFWLSLIPFTTAWMGENRFAQWPVILYGCVLLMNALSYSILYKQLTKIRNENDELEEAVGTGNKEKVSLALYLAGIGTAFISPWISVALYITVAAIWFIPDSRIEKKLKERNDGD